MPSNISGRSNTTFYVNTVSCDLPLNLITNNSSSTTINLGGLNSYGGAGKVMKINSSNDGLEWGSDSDNIYTVVSPLTISNNAISLSNLTGFGTVGQFLKVGANSTLIYGADNDTTYSVVSPLTISNNTISLSNLTGFGTVGQFLKVGANNTLVYGADTNYFTKTSSNISPIQNADNLLIGTGTNTNARKVVIKGTAAQPDGTGAIGALEIVDSSIFFTTGGGMIVNSANIAVISKDGNGNQIGTLAERSEFEGGATSIFRLKGTPNLEMKIDGNATSEITLLRNNGNLFNGDYLKINSAGKVIGQNIVDTKTALVFGGLSAGTGMALAFTPNTGNTQIYSTTFERVNTSQIRPTSINDRVVIANNTYTGNAALYIGGDTKTIADIYCEGKYRINSPSVLLPAPETDFDNYMNYGIAYGRGPDLHGFSGVKFWVKQINSNGTTTDDVRFYVLHNLVNCRADFYLNGVQQFTSDDRLKTDEEDLPFNCLDLLEKMKPKQYKKYNDKLEYTHNELGLIAQDTWNSVKDNDILRDIFVSDIDYNLESNFTENGDLVKDQQKINDKGEIETNYLYINYISYVPILIQSIKDLHLIVKQQQEQINSLLTSKV